MLYRLRSFLVGRPARARAIWAVNDADGTVWAGAQYPVPGQGGAVPGLPGRQIGSLELGPREPRMSEPEVKVEVRKVENGFIMTWGDKTYVALNMSMVFRLQEQLRPK